MLDEKGLLAAEVLKVCAHTQTSTSLLKEALKLHWVEVLNVVSSLHRHISVKYAYNTYTYTYNYSAD